MGLNKNQQIKIAVYGLGKIALEQHIPTIYKSKNFQLVATISHSKTINGIPSFVTLNDLSESLVEVDAIALCMPPEPRYPIALNVIASGYDLLLEKPPCKNVIDCKHLVLAAEKAGVSIFAAWHSKFAPMLDKAREWLSFNKCDHFQVVWSENVLKWHPGQKWVSQSDGFGVLDSGINALSILDYLLDKDFDFKEINFYKPTNWETPITASFKIKADNDIIGMVDFNWLTNNTDIWEIHFFSGSNQMVLSNGGHDMYINEVPVDTKLPKSSEYEALYQHFFNLVQIRQSDFVDTPLRFVEKLYEGATWQDVEAFNIE